jgi:hypothetical protein
MSEDHLNHDLRNKLAWMTKQIHDLWALVRRPVGDQQQVSDSGFFAKLTGNSRDGGNWRWTYQFQEVSKTTAGFGGWTPLGGGRSGSAFNTLESLNGASGILGNGVNTANLGNLTPQPAPTGFVVRMYPVLVGSVPEYEFEYCNGIDGSCS